MKKIPFSRLHLKNLIQYLRVFTMLKIKNLTVKVLDKTILEDFNLEINRGEIHVLMGQNGAGESTISKVLLRDLHYEITNGSIILNEKNLLNMNTTEVARESVFLIGQNPVEIKGVSNAEMLRTTLNDQGKKEENILEFNRHLTRLCEKLLIPKEFIHRDINYNMSGGEKKKMELLHMWMLKPNFIILDEIDSGLDVDSLKLVATSIREYYEEYKPSLLIITHQRALLEIVRPEFVHVLNNKKIVQSGGYELASKIFNEGFTGASIIDKSDNVE